MIKKIIIILMILFLYRPQKYSYILPSLLPVEDSRSCSAQCQNFNAACIYPVELHSQGDKYIEIFDINRERVVKRLQTNLEIQKIVEGYLQGIDEIYGKFNPIPKKGFAVRIPLDPPVKAQSHWLEIPVSEVIIMCPEFETPFLMIFQDEDKLVCFKFKGDTDILLHNLNYRYTNSII